MAKTTLKELYQKKQILLKEELDKELMNQIVGVTKKLQAIDFGPITILDQARDAAVIDISKRAAGGEGGWARFLKSLTSRHMENDPVFDALAFGSAIKNFFPMLEQYTTTMASKGGAKVDTNKKLNEIGSEETSKALENVIKKGLKPEGIVANLGGASWAKKYLKGSSIDDLVQQIMNCSIAEIKKITASVKGGTASIEQVAQNTAESAKENKGEEKKEGGGGGAQKANNAYTKIKDSLGNVDKEKRTAIYNAIKELDKAGLLK